jgi:hypothetical protein
MPYGRKVLESVIEAVGLAEELRGDVGHGLHGGVVEEVRGEVVLRDEVEVRECHGVRGGGSMQGCGGDGDDALLREAACELRPMGCHGGVVARVGGAERFGLQEAEVRGRGLQGLLCSGAVEEAAVFVELATGADDAVFDNLPEEMGFEL